MPARQTVRPIEFLRSGLNPTYLSEPILKPGATAYWLGQGILQLEPTVRSDLPAVIISVGVHGDETVPIRLLDHWLQQWGREADNVHRPMLLILANPLAVAAGTRFIDHNMNRLFSVAEPERGHAEAQRTVEIMTAVQAF
ncbi:MAG: succinylglutamate desuccinylase/aspartoacylase family protein, partial [Natronospirillum sp.]